MNKLNKGDYYVGDPCYIVKDELWSDFLDALWAAENQSRPIFTFQGYTCFVSNTAHGDGCYDDNKGHSYGVDAGLIGAVPINAPFIDTVEKQRYSDYVFSFPTDFWCEAVDMKDEGKITIGYIEIKTDPEPEEEYCYGCQELESECQCCSYCDTYPCVCDEDEEEDDD